MCYSLLVRIAFWGSLLCLESSSFSIAGPDRDWNGLEYEQLLCKIINLELTLMQKVASISGQDYPWKAIWSKWDNNGSIHWTLGSPLTWSFDQSLSWIIAFSSKCLFLKWLSFYLKAKRLARWKEIDNFC